MNRSEVGSPSILIVKLGALGDVVLAMPTVRALRSTFPNARLCWLVDNRHQAILQGMSELDEVIRSDAERLRQDPLVSAGWRRLVTTVLDLRRRRFDLALDLQGLWKSATWARLTGAPIRIGLAKSMTREPASGILLTLQREDPAAARHVSDVYHSAAATAASALGAELVPLGDERGCIRLEAGEIARAGEQLAAAGLAGARLVVINPGAGWVTKRWPVERYAILARELSRTSEITVFVAHGLGEERLAARIVEVAASPRVQTFPSGVRELAAILSQARLFVGGDTGPYHIARDFRVATVAIFGPTDPVLNGPRHGRHEVLWRKLPCAPCYGRTCPTAIECMDEIRVDDVIRHCHEQLARTDAFRERAADSL